MDAICDDDGSGDQASSSAAMLLCLNWVVGYAVSLEYSDCIEQSTSAHANSNDVHPSEGCEVMEVDAHTLAASSPVTDDGVAAAIDALGALLHTPRLADGASEGDLAYLARLARTTRLHLKPASLRALLDPTSAPALHDFPLGFDTGDASVNAASLVLRMLYLFDLRELQHDLNALLVMGQEYTANPYVCVLHSYTPMTPMTRISPIGAQTLRWARWAGRATHILYLHKSYARGYY